MIDLTQYEFWFLTGSQDLYGDETLRQVAEDSKKMVESMNKAGLPCKLIWKPTLLTPNSIHKTLEEANADDKCAGVICWMHTFSPAKMWIAGLNAYKKPLLQLNTQFNVKIPYSTMDMDFMNLNQSAHGDREFGYITARMDIRRKVIVGHWESKNTLSRIGSWMRCACAVADGKKLIVARFGDNMREVAVTDGDKVGAMMQFGWSVPYYGIGDLVAYMDKVSASDIDDLMAVYEKEYTIVWGNDKDFTREHIREQAKIEIALRRFLKDINANALCTNFQDLWGMKQLPGLAIQRLLADGYGFGAEGDWKTSAMVRTVKVMTAGLVGNGKGNAFMEDYTYNLEDDNGLNLGSHMLEVDPQVSVTKPKIEVHPLGIGGKEDPARLVFTATKGEALVTAVVNMAGRFRCVVNEINVIDPPEEFPKLPVARMLWKPYPNLSTSAEAWILAGGGHHTAFSNIVTSEMMRDWAEMTGIECVVIDKNTNIPQFRNELRWNEAYWANRRQFCKVKQMASIYQSLKEEAYAANMQIPQQHLAIYTWGNVSAFDPDKAVFAIKPSGVPYPELTAESMVIVDLDGKIVEGKLKPSSDTKTHCVLYREFAVSSHANIRGIVHTHSPYAVAWAQAQRPVPLFGTTHADHIQTEVPCTPYLSEEMVKKDYETETGNAIVKHFHEKQLNPDEVNMVLVAGHGPFTWGKTPDYAVYNAAVLEEVSKMALCTLQIRSDATPLPQYIIDKHYQRKHGPNAYYGQ